MLLVKIFRKTYSCSSMKSRETTGKARLSMILQASLLLLGLITIFVANNDVILVMLGVPCR